jgi:hypothetical protein
MQFKLKTAGNFYPDVSSRAKLEKLGFKFEPSDYKEYMKADLDDEPTIEITTLDELMDFIKEYGSIVLDEDCLTIYDDYLE